MSQLLESDTWVNPIHVLDLSQRIWLQILKLSILVGGGKKKKKIENGGERSNGVRQEASDYAINPALTSPDMVSLSLS